MVRLNQPGALIFVPDGVEPEAALARTTHLGIGAHPDDLPIMALHGVIECFGRLDRWFLGVTVTDGTGSPRSGPYADHTNELMRAVRAEEEQQAATIGEYSAAVLLDYRSSTVQDPTNREVVHELADLIDRANPDVVYTHNLADRHATHVAVALRTIAALQMLPSDRRPEAVYGCEVWGDLDWLTDADKVVFDVTGHEELAASLLEAYDSQIAAKRYDRATAGRRLAHATFSTSHAVDEATSLAYGMDLTPLVRDDSLEVQSFIQAHLDRWSDEVSHRIERLEGTS